MISAPEVIRRLRVERQFWKRQISTDYIKGIIYGLAIAIVAVNGLHNERRGK